MPGLVFAVMIHYNICHVIILFCCCCDSRLPRLGENLCLWHRPRSGDFCAHGSSIGCACLSCVNTYGTLIGVDGFVLMSVPIVSSLAGGKAMWFPPLYMYITMLYYYRTLGMTCIVKLFCNCWTSPIFFSLELPHPFSPKMTPYCVGNQSLGVFHSCSTTCPRNFV